MSDLLDKLYLILVEGGSWKTILSGLATTVEISAWSLLFGTLAGALLCLLRMRGPAVVRRICAAYIDVLRGTPVLMLLLLLYYGVLARSGADPVAVAVITFSLNVSAHVAELMRTSVEATDAGQVEAARTLGLTAWEAFRLVTLPQAVQIATPVYESVVVNLIQWTSVVGYVTITDLTRVINNVAARTMQPLLTIACGMLIYLALSHVVYFVFSLIGRRQPKPGGGL